MSAPGTTSSQTPRWVFDALGLEFDLDVAAPVSGPLHVPARRWYTAAEDGLAQPWDGTVWCNPPYSRYGPWAHKWTSVERGCLMGTSWRAGRPRPRGGACVKSVDIERTAYEICYKCRGAGMQDSIWEPTCCSVCNGNCVIRIRDARGRFATKRVSEVSA